jgi:hypothetical protein
MPVFSYVKYILKITAKSELHSLEKGHSTTDDKTLCFCKEIKAFMSLSSTPDNFEDKQYLTCLYLFTNIL